ncbi:MAG: hypothetical protein JXP34_16985 [Planctomycetes bacterium]|nr:hypothetical protein [Planctomycetota bacterium]
MDRDSKTRRTLLERLRDGSDRMAWEEFFARYGPLVHGFARRRARIRRPRAARHFLRRL